MKDSNAILNALHEETDNLNFSLEAWQKSIQIQLGNLKLIWEVSISNIDRKWQKNECHWEKEI